MISILPSVDFIMMGSPIVRALPTLDAIYEKFGQHLVITSGRDGKHMVGSLHYKGLAIDLRTYYFEPLVRQDVHFEIHNQLGADYDVVLETTHIHCEYDPK